MSALAKPLLGILLLAFAGVSWAGCPEGQKQTYKGCEVVEEKATETQPAVQQEAKEVNSEIMELGGFIAEEIQIEAAAGQGDATEMTVSPNYDGRGDDWRSIGFKVVLPGDDFEVVSGSIGLVVSWWDSSEKEPSQFEIGIDSTMLPSFDYMEMLRCGSFPNTKHIRKNLEEDGMLPLAFDKALRIQNSSCMYKKLSEADQATVAEMINQIETIVEKGTEGTPDAVYWKTIALRIKANGPLVIGDVGSPEMVVSLVWDDRGDDWRSIGFDVEQSVDDGAEIVGGRLEIVVSWTGGSEKEPDRIRLKFDSMTLPSIDYQMMRGCNGWDESLVREDSTIRLAFWGFTKFEASRCIYNKLSQADQALVSNFVNQIYNIVEKGTEGAPDADYWKKIAFRIRVNSPFILSSPASGHYYCINAEDGRLAVYLAAESNCEQSEHGPIERLNAASKVRALLKDMSLDAISQNELGKP